LTLAFSASLSTHQNGELEMQKRVALYVRVSTTKGQTVKNQERELRSVGKRHGWNIVAVHADEGISGAKGRDKRPALDALLKMVARREIDLVAAWSVDRLGRSLQDLVTFLNELHAKGVDLYLHQQGLDTTTPAGKAMFQVMGVFAEFERAIIRERILAGLARARAEGRRGGRPRVSRQKEDAVREALGAGNGIRASARLAGVGLSVVQRLRRTIVRKTRKKTN
jgi:DNA invertase Pin-like site-specific DNA recombinase